MANFLFMDIDRTVSDSSWRDKFMPQEKNGDWSKYHEKAINDELITETHEMICSLLRDDWILIGFTARPERSRTMTEKWLKQADLPVADILMRADDDLRLSAVVKKDLYVNYIGSPSFKELGDPIRNVIIVIDDHADVCAALNEVEGCLVLQVHHKSGKDVT